MNPFAEEYIPCVSKTPQPLHYEAVSATACVSLNRIKGKGKKYKRAHVLREHQHAKTGQKHDFNMHKNSLSTDGQVCEDSGELTQSNEEFSGLIPCYEATTRKISNTPLSLNPLSENLLAGCRRNKCSFKSNAKNSTKNNSDLMARDSSLQLKFDKPHNSEFKTNSHSFDKKANAHDFVTQIEEFPTLSKSAIKQTCATPKISYSETLLKSECISSEASNIKPHGVSANNNMKIDHNEKIKSSNASLNIRKRIDQAAEKYRLHWMDVASQVMKSQQKMSINEEEIKLKPAIIPSALDAWHSLLRPDYTYSQVDLETTLSRSTDNMYVSQVDKVNATRLGDFSFNLEYLNFYGALISDDYSLLQHLLDLDKTKSPLMNDSKSYQLFLYAAFDSSVWNSSEISIKNASILEKKLRTSKLRGTIDNVNDFAKLFDGCYAIHICAALGNLSCLEIILISLGHGHSYIDFKDRVNKSTAAHYACNAGYFSAAGLLLSYGASFTLKDKLGETILHKAVRSKNSQMVSWVAERFKSFEGLKLNCRSKQGETALMLCTSPAIAITLISMGCDPTFVNDEGYDSIYLAAAKGNDQLLKALITANRSHNNPKIRLFQNSKENPKSSPLLAICKHGHEKCLEVLMQSGQFCILSLLHSTLEKTGILSTPLHIAAANGHLKILAFLLSKLTVHEINVFLTYEDSTGLIPLTSAALAGHDACVLLLVQEGLRAGVTYKEKYLEFAVKLFRLKSLCSLKTNFLRSLGTGMVYGLKVSPSFLTSLMSADVLQYCNEINYVIDSQNKSFQFSKFKFNLFSCHRVYPTCLDQSRCDLRIICSDSICLYYSFILRKQSKYFSNLFCSYDECHSSVKSSCQEYHTPFKYTADFQQFSLNTIEIYLTWITKRNILFEKATNCNSKELIKFAKYICDFDYLASIEAFLVLTHDHDVRYSLATDNNLYVIFSSFTDLDIIDTKSKRMSSIESISNFILEKGPKTLQDIHRSLLSNDYLNTTSCDQCSSPPSIVPLDFVFSWVEQAKVNMSHQEFIISSQMLAHSFVMKALSVMKRRIGVSNSIKCGDLSKVDAEDVPNSLSSIMRDLYVLTQSLKQAILLENTSNFILDWRHKLKCLQDFVNSFSTEDVTSFQNVNILDASNIWQTFKNCYYDYETCNLSICDSQQLNILDLYSLWALNSCQIGACFKLYNLLGDSENYDVIIVESYSSDPHFQSEKHFAHLGILFNACPKLEAMIRFQTNINRFESQVSTVCINTANIWDINEDNEDEDKCIVPSPLFQYVLQFIYIGFIPGPEDYQDFINLRLKAVESEKIPPYYIFLQRLWLLADEYLMEELMAAVESKMCDSINELNAEYYYSFAQNCNLKKLLIVSSTYHILCGRHNKGSIKLEFKVTEPTSNLDNHSVAVITSMLETLYDD